MVESRERSPREDLDTSVPSSFICNGPTWKTAPVFISSGRDGAGTHLHALQWDELLTWASTGERQKERRQTEKACLCDAMCDTLEL